MRNTGQSIRLNSVKILETRGYPLPPVHHHNSIGHNARLSSGSRHSKLGLGVNERTGRLQWCPGLTCCKLWVIIPVIMLPIVLVLILLMRMDGMLMALRIQQQDQMNQNQQLYRLQQDSSLANDYDLGNHNLDDGVLQGDTANSLNEQIMWPYKPQAMTEAERIRRCISFKFGMSESVDAEDRDIMRDARTSFLPAGSTTIPRECLEPFGYRYSPKLYNMLQDSPIGEEYLRRYWRSTIETNNTEAVEIVDDDDGEDNGEVEIDDGSTDPGDRINAVAEVRSGEDDVGFSEMATSLQSFWNEEGTKQSIRSVQANTMKKYIDPNIDPCVDFYKFACGNWEKLHPIPKDKAGFDTFEMLRENLDSVLKQLLESPDDGGPPTLQSNDMNNKPKGNVEDGTDVDGETSRRNPINQNPSIAMNGVNKPTNVNNNQNPLNQRPDLEFDQDSNDENDPERKNPERNRPQPRSDPAPFKTDTSYETTREKRAAELVKHIVKRRDVLSRLLMRFKRQTTNTKRKRLISTMNNNADRPNNPRPQPQIDMSNSAQRKAKQLYQSCINTALLQKRGIQPLLQLIDSLGGWPVLYPNWDEQRFDWLDLAARLRRFNNDILLVQWVGPDIKNSDENVIQFDQTSLGLPTREYFLQDSNARYLQAYQRFMAEVMNRLGASRDIALQTATDLINFETQLASITSPAEERLNVTKLYKRMTLKQLHETIPDINWKRYLTILQQRDVQDSEEVVLYAMDYMTELVNLLSHSKPRTVANYMVWRFVRHRINNVDDRFEDIKQNFYHTLFGREESPSRWKVCIAQVNTNMGMALGSMFVQRFFDENSKRDTLKMTHELQQAFRDILKNTNWIDPSTKRLAALKVNAMSLKIGYPDFILNPRELNEKYAGIEIHPDTYFENTLNVLLHTSKTEQAKLHESVNKTTWQTAPAIVNAYYSRNKNQIMFPAGILQPPFYHRHFPRSLNFGGIGVVIGHELTHGFDDKGRLFDRNGSIHKWWTDESIKGFDERARCIIAQYNNYTVSEVGIAINGESTQGENIADNGGIRQAFHAYKRWLNDNPQAVEDERLPGINMSGEQLFFLNFGQVWCGAMRPEAVRNKLNTAIHSPGRFRVIGTLSNSVDFAREFKCPLGSPMNPEHKCSVW